MTKKMFAAVLIGALWAKNIFPLVSEVIPGNFIHLHVNLVKVRLLALKF